MTAIRRFSLPFALTVVVAALAISFWNRTEEIGIDFHTYEAAAQVGVQEGWSHIYDQRVVTPEQKDVAPGQRTQPFLSPPPVAWLAALLSPLPFMPAFYIWATAMLAAYVLALALSATSTGIVRWIAIAAATAPWWVSHAVSVGQIAPLVAAGVVLAWWLVREQREIAAGLVLSLIAMKPNTAFLVPFALLAAGRYRTLAGLSIAGAAMVVATLLTVGPNAIGMYMSQLQHPPTGASSLTLEGALGIGRPEALVLRLAIVFAVLGVAFKLRRSPDLVIAAGVLGSLVVAPYLHASDLCLLSGAAFIVWEQRHTRAWRIPLAAAWLLASSYLVITHLSPGLNRWPLVELCALIALIVVAGRADAAGNLSAGEPDLRKQAPA